MGVVPSYYHWLVAGLVVALVMGGTIVSLRFGFRGFVWFYSAVAVLAVVRVLAVNAPFVPVPLIVPSLLLLLAFLALIAWTLATVLRPWLARLCVRKN